ncbi:hypothetical protein LCGC14_1626040 [marine sediment metagenome]|uniref:Uncharacterized protein n=1 Tax=marine sediment metagenome TaxID=412755 RepID=A0A0F9IR04_9ZZZZ
MPWNDKDALTPQALNSRSGLVFNVKDPDFGAVGDGSTDDTAAITAAISAATTAGGGVVHFSRGTYLVDNLVLADNVALAGEGYHSVLLQSGATNTALVSYTGTQAAPVAVTTASGVSSGDTGVTVGATSSFATDDYVVLGSDELVPNSTAGDTTFGELLEVQGIDSSTLSFRGMVTRNYAPGDTPSALPVTMLEGARVNNLRMVNNTPGTLTNGFVSFRFCREPRTENVWFEKGDGSALFFGHCAGGAVNNSWARDLTDDSGNNRFGYHILAAGATRDLRISNFHTIGGRHAFTTGGVSSAKTGTPQGIAITNGTCTGSGQPGFDTHQEGLNITFVNCSSIGNLSRGFRTRAPRTKFVGCVADTNLTDGFHISSDASNCQIQDCTASNNKQVGADGTGNGFRIEAPNAILSGCVAQNNNRAGFLIGNGSGGREVTDTVLVNCRSTNNHLGTTADAGCVHLDSKTTGVTLSGCDLSNETNAVFFTEGSGAVRMLGCNIHDMNSAATFGGVLPTDMAILGNIGAPDSIGQHFDVQNDSALFLNGTAFQLVTSDTTADDANKSSRLGALPYSSNSAPIVVAFTQGRVSSNILSVGGGTSAGLAATEVDIYTAANNNTATGTRQVRVDSAGRLILSASTLSMAEAGAAGGLAGDATGEAGEIAWGSSSNVSFLYVCVSSNSWMRATLNPF